MKISNDTINILKNFASINPSILVKPGNVIKTISPQRTIFATAEVGELFPNEFAIYEVTKFLSTLTLFDEPDIEFYDDHLKISQGKKSVRYVYADPSMVVSAPDKVINLPSQDVKFELVEDDLTKLQKAISILRVPEMSVVGEDGTIYVKGINNKNPSSDSFSIAVGVTDKAFNMIFKSENLKIIPRDYEIIISSKGISKFTSKDVEYFIATEATSRFGE